MPSLLLIGTGRTAFHLGHAFKRAGRLRPGDPGVRLVGVVGRDRERTAKLAKTLKCDPFALGDPLPKCDLVLIAVSDDAIGAVAKRIPKTKAVVAHTSGTQTMQVLGKRERLGVLWPIQSLSPGEPIDLHNVPVVIDSSDREARAVMLAAANAISTRVLELPHKQREGLHLAATIASNFPVFLLREAGRLLKAQNLDPTLVVPLWKSTAERAASIGPDDALTGPARRGDHKTIEKHMARFTGERDLRRAYALLSRMILKAHGHTTDGLEDL